MVLVSKLTFDCQSSGMFLGSYPSLGGLAMGQKRLPPQRKTLVKPVVPRGFDPQPFERNFRPGECCLTLELGKTNFLVQVLLGL